MNLKTRVLSSLGVSLLVAVAWPGNVAATTFNYTGSLQTYTVPSGVTTIHIVAKGAQGGAVASDQGGLGAMMSGDFTVTPGEVLNVIVGGQGSQANTTSSGGGGGSGVHNAGTPLIIAGGGGGIDTQQPNYPGKDAVTGTSGVAGQSGGGAGGTAGSDGGDTTFPPDSIARGGRGWNSGHDGSTGQAGVSSQTFTTKGSWGLGGGGGSVENTYCNCGAGGGGYSGGGAGAINNSGGGGGSYNVGFNQVNVAGDNTGNGIVIITEANVPALGGWALTLLALTLGVAGAFALRLSN